MLDPSAHAGSADFQKFLDLASQGSVTEAGFQECFGLTFAEGEKALSNYVRETLRTPLEILPKISIPKTSFKPRQATKAEIFRIKGELERLEAGYVRRQNPAFSKMYLEQSLRTFQSATSEADRKDPRLLAAEGLSESEANHTARARELLEAATHSGVVRPAAYCELARLRLAEARAHPLGPDGKLSVTQTAAVLGPLFTARQQHPPLAEVYTLIAETWSNSAFVSTRRELAVLDEGVRLFPGDTTLIFAATSVHAQRGFIREASQFAQLGEKIAGPDEAARNRFVQLQATLNRSQVQRDAARKP